MDIIDARGLSCPEPVILVRNAMASKAPAYQVLVDSIVCRENVTRFAEHQGYRVAVSEKNGDIVLDITKE